MRPASPPEPVAPAPPAPPPTDESPHDLIVRTCLERSIDVAAFLGRNTARYLVQARRAVALELRERGIALATIGAFLGGRDHTTVSNLLRPTTRQGTPR